MSEKTPSTATIANLDRISVTSRRVLSDGWIRLEQVEYDYRRTDGTCQRLIREIHDHGHGAAVLLYNQPNRSIVLTRQFRLPAWETGENGFLWEVPAGLIEGDNPADTVRMETQQETGFVIGKPQFLFKAFTTPGSVTEQVHYFVCQYNPSERIGTGGGLREEGEDIEVAEIPIDTAISWIADGSLMDSKTIILVQYAQLHLF